MTRGATTIWQAIKENNESLVSLLLSDVENVNIRDQWGETPLHIAGLITMFVML